MAKTKVKKRKLDDSAGHIDYMVEGFDFESETWEEIGSFCELSDAQNRAETDQDYSGPTRVKYAGIVVETYL